MKKPMVFYKPNITNLKGKRGKLVIQEIRSTPRPDFTEANKKVANLMAQIQAARDNGTY